MTVIVYRDGVMASDTGIAGGGVRDRWARKLVRGSAGVLYGVAGDAAAGSKFIAWVEAGEEGEMPEPGPFGGSDGRHFSALIWRPGDGLYLLEPGGLIDCRRSPYMAIGSGAGVATGALWMGADAQTAVLAAIEHAEGVSGDVAVIQC